MNPVGPHSEDRPDDRRFACVRAALNIRKRAREEARKQEAKREGESHPSLFSAAGSAFSPAGGGGAVVKRRSDQEGGGAGTAFEAGCGAEAKRQKVTDASFALPILDYEPRQPQPSGYCIRLGDTDYSYDPKNDLRQLLDLFIQRLSQFGPKSLLHDIDSEQFELALTAAVRSTVIFSMVIGEKVVLNNDPLIAKLLDQLIARFNVIKSLSKAHIQLYIKQKLSCHEFCVYHYQEKFIQSIWQDVTKDARSASTVNATDGVTPPVDSPSLPLDSFTPK